MVVDGGGTCDQQLEVGRAKCGQSEGFPRPHDLYVLIWDIYERFRARS